MSYKEPALPDTEEEYMPPIPMLRTSRARQVNTRLDQPVTRTTEPVLTRRHFHVGKPGWFVLAGVLIALALWTMWQQAVVPTWGNLQDQWHYGDSRITQLDANIGHGGESHFVAEYYQGSIVVMEISLTNLKDFHPYVLTGMIGASETPVLLLSVADMNHDGKPDLVIQIKGTTFQTVLYNTGTTFSEREG